MKYKITYLITGPIIEKSKERNFEQSLTYEEAKSEITNYYLNAILKIKSTKNFEDYLFNVLWEGEENG